MNLSSFQVVYHIGVKAEGVSCCDYEACCVKSADAKVGAGTVGLLANDIITDMGSGAIIKCRSCLAYAAFLNSEAILSDRLSIFAVTN